MSYTGLSLDQAPPLMVPLRFFFTVPVFGLFAACILLWAGPDIFSSRHAPHALAFTHTITLGFICMTMFGAMQQLLPVLVGSSVNSPVLFSTALHSLLSLGALSLVLGFLSELKAFLLAGLVLLLFAFVLFLTVSLTGLARAKTRTPTVACMWLSCISLAIAIGLGLFLGADRIRTTTHHWGDIHLIWALGGWVGLMVMGVAYQVVPMFQLTPSYPARMRYWLAPTLFILLLIYTCIRLLPEAWRHGILQPHNAALGLLVGLSTFALRTLRLQQQRRRKVSDITMDYWRLGMICLLVFSTLWLAGVLWLPAAEAQEMEIFLGLLLIIGTVISLICGMLYKIIPFLMWFHLQSSLDEYVKLPSMKELLPDSSARRQFHVHMAVIITLLAASIQPVWFTYPAAVLFAASNIMLGINMLVAYRTYRETKTMLSTLGEGS